MQILVRADDFGLSDGATMGVIKAYEDGIVRSTSIIVNQEASERSCKLLKDLDICAGLHVNIVLGKPVSDNGVDNLIDSLTGDFYSSKHYRSVDKNTDPLAGLDNEVELEVEAQYNEYIKLVGKKPEYIDGHAIVSNTVDKAIERVAEKYDIKFIGYYGGQSKNIKTIPLRLSSVYDEYKKGKKPEEILNELIKDIKNDTYLIVIHPGYLDYFLSENSTMMNERFYDLEFATCSETLEVINHNSIELISHRNL